MRLLFDQNLSLRLVARLADLFPESVHVRHVGLERGDDQAVWDYAAAHGLAIVSKDSDFHQRSFLFGPPPKVIWVRLANCSTAEIERLLRTRLPEIRSFLEDRDAAFLALS